MGGLFSFFPSPTFLHLRSVSVMEGLTCELSVGAPELGWHGGSRVITMGDDGQFLFFCVGCSGGGCETHLRRSSVNPTGTETHRRQTRGRGGVSAPIRAHELRLRECRGV